MSEHCCDPDDACPKHRAALAKFFAEVERIMGARQIATEVSPGTVVVTYEREPKQ